jgi:hypothetical protein
MSAFEELEESIPRTPEGVKMPTVTIRPDFGDTRPILTIIDVDEETLLYASQARQEMWRRSIANRPALPPILSRCTQDIFKST